jgi:hypothetical protein
MSLFAGCAISTKIVEEKDNSDLVKSLMKNNFEILNNKGFISKKLLKKLNKDKTFNSKYVFANPDEDANLTDLYYGKMPNTLIVELGKFDNLVYIIYDKGGFVITRNCLIYEELGRNRFRIYYPHIPPNINNINDLKNHLKNQI